MYIFVPKNFTVTHFNSIHLKIKSQYVMTVTHSPTFSFLWYNFHLQ